MATILVAVFCAGEFEGIKIQEGQSLEWGYGFCAGMEVGALMYGGGISAYVVPDEEARMRHEATAKRIEEIEKTFQEAADIRAKLGAHDIDTNDGGLSVLGRDPESPRRQALKAETTEPNLIARLSLAIRKAWAAPPVGTSSEQAARAVIAELAVVGMEAHDMPKLAYVARAAFDRASAAGDEDPFKYVVERILLVASNVPTHAVKEATVSKQVSDEVGLPPRPDPVQDLVYRLARTIYGVEERARRPRPVLFDDLYTHTKEEYRSAARAVLADLTTIGVDVLGGPLSGSDEILETASDYAARAAAELWAKGWRAIIDRRNVNQKMYDAFQAGARWAYSRVAPIIAAKDETMTEQAREVKRLSARCAGLENDVALADVARLTTEAEAMAKRLRILEIAPKAAFWANHKTGYPASAGDAERAAKIISDPSSYETSIAWTKYVLEYVAREGGLT